MSCTPLKEQRGPRVGLDLTLPGGLGTESSRIPNNVQFARRAGLYFTYEMVPHHPSFLQGAGVLVRPEGEEIGCSPLGEMGWGHSALALVPLCFRTEGEVLEAWLCARPLFCILDLY